MGTARAKDVASEAEGAAKTREAVPAPKTAAVEMAGDAMVEVNAALDAIRRAFRSMASDGAEVASLREQLARSRAETRKAEAAYRQTLQIITAQLRDLA